MYKILADNNVNQETFANIYTIYDPELFDDGYQASDISMTKELSKAGSLSFKMPALNPSYASIIPFGTTIVVTSDNKVIWYGRVVSVSRDFYNNKNVKCEDAMAFLNDIMIKPFMYRYGTDGSTIANHFTNVMSLYHNRCSKKRDVSYIGGELPDEFKDLSTYAVRGVDSFQTVFDEITGICSYDDDVDIVMRYSGFGTPGLVIGKMPYAMVEQPIEIGVNLIDVANDVDYSTLYTSLIPLDENNKTLGDNYYVDEDGLTSVYGIIEKTIQVGSVTNDSLVRNFCRRTASKDAKSTSVSKITLTALDMYYISVNSITAIEPGLLVQIISPAHDLYGYYTCVSMQIDLQNPETASYSFKYYGDKPL